MHKSRKQDEQARIFPPGHGEGHSADNLPPDDDGSQHSVMSLTLLKVLVGFITLGKTKSSFRNVLAMSS